MNIELVGIWPYSAEYLRAELRIESKERIETERGDAAHYAMTVEVLVAGDQHESFDALAARVCDSLSEWLGEKIAAHALSSQSIVLKWNGHACTTSS